MHSFSASASSEAPICRSTCLPGCRALVTADRRARLVAIATGKNWTIAGHGRSGESSALAATGSMNAR